MTERKPGEVLDALGVVLDLDDDQQVVEVVVLAKTVGFGDDSRTGLIVTSNPGLDWISQLGLFEAGRQVLTADPPVRGGD